MNVWDYSLVQRLVKLVRLLLFSLTDFGSSLQKSPPHLHLWACCHGHMPRLLLPHPVPSATQGLNSLPEPQSPSSTKDNPAIISQSSFQAECYRVPGCCLVLTTLPRGFWPKGIWNSNQSGFPAPLVCPMIALILPACLNHIVFWWRERVPTGPLNFFWFFWSESNKHLKMYLIMQC